MIVIAKDSITRPDALAPYLDDQMRAVRELKAEGVIKSAYRRTAGPGGYLILEDPASTPCENESTPFPLSSRTS